MGVERHVQAGIKLIPWACSKNCLWISRHLGRHQLIYVMCSSHLTFLHGIHLVACWCSPLQQDWCGLFCHVLGMVIKQPHNLAKSNKYSKLKCINIDRKCIRIFQFLFTPSVLCNRKFRDGNELFMQSSGNWWKQSKRSY